MDLLNELADQLSSCPAKARGLCRTVSATVWEAISSLGGAATLGAVQRGSCDGCSSSEMGTVKSRDISSGDNSIDDINVAACSSGLKQDHNQRKGFCGNGGYLQKNDLCYDIGNNSHYQPVRQPSIRSRSQQPMPTTEELERKFTKVLVCNIFDISQLLPFKRTHTNALNAMTILASCY